MVKDWVVTQELKVQHDFACGQHLLLPGFDLDQFPFIVDYGTGKLGNKRSATYNLINLKSGHKDRLI